MLAKFRISMRCGGNCYACHCEHFSDYRNRSRAVKVEVDLMRALPGFDIVGSKNVKKYSLYRICHIL